MELEEILQPLDGSEPCGPDLDEIGDDEYLSYMLPAEDRLPSRFFDGNGAPFDRTTVDLKREITAISSLLAKSRDLRLLALEARFQILAGQIVGFCDAIAKMSALVDRHWDAVNPRPFDGDHTMRVNTLGGLDDRTTVILPLQHATIVRDRRIGPVSSRQYAVATGKTPPRDGEAVADAGALMDALRSVENREAITTVHAALVNARAGLAATRARFIDEVGYEQAPRFDGLDEVLGDVAGLLEEALPELGSGGVSGQDAGASAEAGDEFASPAPTLGAAAPAGPAPSAPASSAPIGSHADAIAALYAAEQYFGRAEPSSPALVLVHQARTLIGKPMVAAIEALMPESADRLKIRFDGAMKFQLDINRVRTLTDSIAEGSLEAPLLEHSSNEYAAKSRAEAAGLMAAVEAYYKTAEPSSPVPMLLSKARAYLSRDFLAILNDLIDKET